MDSIIKYIPLQQGLRHNKISFAVFLFIIKYIPLQQGLRQLLPFPTHDSLIIKYIPLQQGLRLFWIYIFIINIYY